MSTEPRKNAKTGNNIPEPTVNAALDAVKGVIANAQAGDVLPEPSKTPPKQRKLTDLQVMSRCLKLLNRLDPADAMHAMRWLGNKTQTRYNEYCNFVDPLENQ